MATERVVDGGVRSAAGRLRTSSRAILPSGRALLGALLLAVSGVATFVAWRGAAVADGPPYVVASHRLAPGRTVSVDDLRVVSLALPPEQAARAFHQVDEVAGRLAYGPIDEGELVQAGQVSAQEARPATIELALSLPRDRLVDGSLRAGDWVDVFKSDDAHTEEVVSHVQVVDVSSGDPASLVADDEMVVTLALIRASDRLGVIDAIRRAEVTLTRSATTAEGPG